MTILQAQKEYLEYGKGCIPVEPCEFYRDIFGKGNIEPTADTDENGVPIYDNEEHMYTPIFIEQKKLKDKKAFGIRHYLTDDNIEDKIENLTKSDNFIFGSPISYAGRKRDAKGARHLYALCVEIDDLKHSDEEHRLYPDGLKYLYERFDGLLRNEKGQPIPNIFPCPTYLVLSGTGIHLYYVFETPLNLYPNVAKSLEEFKRELTKWLWNKYVTYRYTYDKIQFESIYQGFRLVGGVTKNGERTVCYRIGDKVSVEYLNSSRYWTTPESHIITSYKLDNDRLTLNEAKTLYPEWYQERIVEKRPKKTWTCDRKVYEWWRDKQLPKVAVGHRYYCLYILCIYAVKCDISREELERDCYALIPYLDSLTEKEDNHFTSQDVRAALKAYDNPRNKTYPLNSIRYKSGIMFPKNKRNGRTRAQHVKIMNFMRDEILHKTNWREGNGRPSAELIVLEWQQQHPQGRKADCIRDTGLTKPTVYKWWQG